MDKELQDAADAIRTWLAVVEYGMVAVVALLFITTLLLFIMLYQVIRLRDQLKPPRIKTGPPMQPPAPPQYHSEFNYDRTPTGSVRREGP